MEALVCGFETDGMMSRARKPTVAKVQKLASLFDDLDADWKNREYTQVEVRHELDKDTVLTGTIDYIGPFAGQKAIVDIKYTSSWSNVWSTKSGEFIEDMPQSFLYPAIVWLQTGELLPFFYVVAGDDIVDDLKVIKIERTEDEIKEFIRRLQEKLSDRNFWGGLPENPHPSTCLGIGCGISPGISGGKCRYRNSCPFFKEGSEKHIQDPVEYLSEKRAAKRREPDKPVEEEEEEIPF